MLGEGVNLEGRDALMIDHRAIRGLIPTERDPARFTLAPANFRTLSDTAARV
jgi:hypothetical protein